MPFEENVELASSHGLTRREWLFANAQAEVRWHEGPVRLKDNIDTAGRGIRSRSVERPAGLC